jgi:hypothetical protein
MCKLVKERGNKNKGTAIERVDMEVHRISSFCEEEKSFFFVYARFYSVLSFVS